MKCTAIKLSAVILAGLGLSLAAWPALAAPPADPTIVVVLEGVGDLLDEDDAPLPEPALCYEADLFNAHTGSFIGTGIDCLEDIVADADTGIITLDRTTFFSFPHGELVASGVTTVAPILEGSPGFTHVVGDIPASGFNSIVSGTKRFANSTGRVRLSGAVDLSNFDDGAGSVGFNCVFVIDLD